MMSSESMKASVATNPVSLWSLQVRMDQRNYPEEYIITLPRNSHLYCQGSNTFCIHWLPCLKVAVQIWMFIARAIYCFLKLIPRNSQSAFGTITQTMFSDLKSVHSNQGIRAVLLPFNRKIYTFLAGRILLLYSTLMQKLGCPTSGL